MGVFLGLVGEQICEFVVYAAGQSGLWGACFSMWVRFAALHCCWQIVGFGLSIVVECFVGYFDYFVCL